MVTPIKSLFPPIEKKPFLLNKKKAGAVARRRVSTLSFMSEPHHVENNDNIEKYINLISTKIFLFRISEPYLMPRN